MKKRQIFTLLLCVALLVGTVGAAFVPQEKPQLQNSVVWGTVETIDGRTLHVKNSSDSPLNDVIIHMDENAPIIDAVSGTALELSSVKAGQTVYVTIGPATTKSLPPQATGLALITNIPADFRVPTYITIDRVIASDEKGVLAEVLAADGSLKAKITEDTIISRYVKPGDVSILSIPTVDELKPGCGLFVWFGMSTASNTAQTTLTQCVIVPSSYDGYVDITETTLTYDGAAVTLLDSQKSIQNAAGDTLVALRPVAEAAGWKLTWVAKDQPSTLTKGEQTITITLGSSDVQVGTETISLRQAARIQNATTYVDADFLMQALNLYTTIGG